jgi:hypothetical protein
VADGNRLAAKSRACAASPLIESGDGGFADKFACGAAASGAVGCGAESAGGAVQLPMLSAMATEIKQSIFAKCSRVRDRLGFRPASKSK